MDIVYIYRDNPKYWKHEELRYSIRSVCKYLSFGNIFIVGGFPDYLSSRAINIKEPDASPHKQINAMKKILAACADKRVSDDFLLMNDDFIFLSETKKIRCYNTGKISETIEKRQPNKSIHPILADYRKSMENSLSLLSRMGFADPIDFEVHYPIVVNKKKFCDIISRHADTPAVYRSIYLNAIGAESEFIQKDFKCYNLTEFLKKSRGEFLSSDDKISRSDIFKRWCADTFYRKSYFEI